MVQSPAAPKPSDASVLVAALDGHYRAELCGVKAHVNTNTPYGVVVLYRDNDYSKTGMDWLDQEADRNGWYRTRSETQDERKLAFFEPRNVPPVPTPKELYHATDVGNADRILKNGFELAAIGRTWMARTYITPRVFFATSLSDAGTFIRSIKGKASATTAAALTLADLQAWEILKIDPSNRTYYEDVEFQRAVWTEEDVPARDVFPLVGWRDGVLP